MKVTVSPARVTHSVTLVLVITLWSLIGCPLHCRGQSHPPSSMVGQIDLLSAKQLSGSSAVHFEVTISYDFPGRQTVWLQGIGSLPSKGRLSYDVRGRRIEFRTAKGGVLLGYRTITSYSQTPETGSLYPPTTQFGGPQLPVLVLPLALPQATAFVMNLLGNEGEPFRLSFTACRPDDDGCIVSQWTTITNPTEHMQAQISVMLTYAADRSNRGATVIKVFYVGRQAYRGGSEWSSSLNDSVRSSLEDRVAILRKRILGKLSK